MIDEYKAEAVAPRLTPENHPENQPAPAPAAAARTSTLLRTIVVCILGGIIGMIYGVAALSSTLTLDEPASLLSVLPLVVALVVLQTGYWGAIVCMCKDEAGD